uniref:Coiled-coil domain containing 136 n=1 Tax=Molossus molossus TaxID=27622 RepID=A0A7J8H9Q1_MOLMO|nr:coiled-coil domain containing 136 [Molossus molossus]
MTCRASVRNCLVSCKTYIFIARPVRRSRGGCRGSSSVPRMRCFGFRLPTMPPRTRS